MTLRSPEPGRPVLLQAVHMSKEFARGGSSSPLAVLKDVSLTLLRGELVSIIGASGAGKSTLLHCLGTLDLPTRGQLEFEGTEILSLTPPDLAKFRNEAVGFVFQFHHLLPEFTALENVMMPALIGRLSIKDARARALKILDDVAMTHRLSHRPGELSGGEQQRVAIARALVMKPKLLLADEPTGNLDTTTGSAVHQLLFRLNEEHDITMLLVTHNRALASEAPRVIEMADGRLISDHRNAQAGPP